MVCLSTAIALNDEHWFCSCGCSLFALMVQQRGCMWRSGSPPGCVTEVQREASVWRKLLQVARGWPLYGVKSIKQLVQRLRQTGVLASPF
jgi:hypothetical protein